MFNCRYVSFLVPGIGVLAVAPGVQGAAMVKLTVSDGPRNHNFGCSVSINGDVAAVGANWDVCESGFGCGAVYVYRFNGSDWVEEQKLTASDAIANAGFGRSVSVSGNVILVGSGPAPLSEAAYVFRFDGATWVQEQKLTASDTPFPMGFATSVSVSGNAAVVGAPGHSCPPAGICGASYFFRYNGASWIEEYRSQPCCFFERAGTSVAISGDVVVEGAPDADCVGFFGFLCGQATVYRYDGANWSPTQVLRASNAQEDDRFGLAVSVDGNVVIVGSAGLPGGTYVYRYDGFNWMEEQIMPPAGWQSNAVSGDVAVLAGFPSARVFSHNIDWVEDEPLLSCDGAYDKSVSVSGDLAIVGAPDVPCEAGEFCGSAYVYTLGVPVVCPPIAPQTEPDGVSMNRFLGIVVPAPIMQNAQAGTAKGQGVPAEAGPGSQTALRVTLTSLHHPPSPPPGTPNFAAFEGAKRYVNSFGGPGASLDCPDAGPPFNTSYKCARLGCEPEYRDWATELAAPGEGQPQVPGLIYIIGDAVVPSSMLDVSHIAGTCGAAATANTCVDASAPLAVVTAQWGDSGSGGAGPPDGATNVIDIGLVVDKVKGLPTALPERNCWLKQQNSNPQVDPINVIDIGLTVDSVKGLPYPYDIAACP